MKTEKNENQQNVKKLFLNKETLALLNEKQMNALYGGRGTINNDGPSQGGCGDGPKTTC
jgi:natural product precursor